MKYHSKPFLPTKPLSVSLPKSVHANCRLWPIFDQLDQLFNQSPHLLAVLGKENTGDMVGPGIRTQDLSHESLAPYHSELSGQPNKCEHVCRTLGEFFHGNSHVLWHFGEEFPLYKAEVCGGIITKASGKSLTINHSNLQIAKFSHLLIFQLTVTYSRWRWEKCL